MPSIAPSALFEQASPVSFTAPPNPSVILSAVLPVSFATPTNPSVILSAVSSGLFIAT